ncbi:molybdopterin molybdotransferase MoeA [Corynebacterium bouchesdurhonense]|uniref:molybdopterin molybdotransferase MoeA n=1 Tax=Corynebacterium bouchesdurhonense TaxID=1720192 RepID=UPI0008321711|nr:molybdopterin molybdotransferase MoeA [Corynebacterium bouchesdurhonense]
MARTPEAHLAAVRELVPALPAEAVVSATPIDAAKRGARLAAEVRAVRDSPAFDNSQMDGYALPAATAGTYTTGPTVAAGADPDALYPHGLAGLAAPVMTGAKLPRGTAAVVAVETCQPGTFVADGEVVRAPAAAPGQYIRRAGTDIAAGEVLAPAGVRVTPALVGALAAQGVEAVPVHRAARILVVTGGAEIGRPGAAAIPDSNGPALEALAARHGIEVAGRLRTDDDPDALRRAAAEAVEVLAPDAVVTSGGISHGKFEVVRQAFPHGWYGHVAQQPGGPQGLSSFRGVPVISLPGNPVSTLVSFRLYVAPVLGHAPAPVWVPLGGAEPVEGLAGREQFLRGRVEDGLAVPLGGAGSHLLSQGAGADCLIRVPAGARLRPGELALVYAV